MVTVAGDMIHVFLVVGKKGLAGMRKLVKRGLWSRLLTPWKKEQVSDRKNVLSTSLFLCYRSGFPIFVKDSILPKSSLKAELDRPMNVRIAWALKVRESAGGKRRAPTVFRRRRRDSEKWNRDTSSKFLVLNSCKAHTSWDRLKCLGLWQRQSFFSDLYGLCIHPFFAPSIW